MHPVTDIDALLLLAMTLACKRRPAELVEIVAAADLLQLSVPPAAKLGEAFSRLSRHGLISESDGRFALTPAAQHIVTGLPRKADSMERLFTIRENLAALVAKDEFPPVTLGTAQIDLAILTHRKASQAAAKNLLVAKSKTADAGVRRRKPLPARRRKD